jgi:hypothetical protein
MASQRLPGATCVTDHPPIDFRTSQLAPTPPQGPVGVNVGDSRFDAKDVESLKMFETSLKYRSSEELHHLQARMEYLYEEAVRASGPESREAAFFATSLAMVENRFALLQSPSGKAKARLQELIDALKKGTAVKDEDVSEAIGDVLTAERDEPESDAPSGSEAGSAMGAVAEALKEVSRVKNKRFKDLLEKAKQPGANVTDDQIKQELGPVLALERQKQLLGVDDGNTMDLVVDALDFSHERRKSGLSELLDKVESGKHRVTRAQVQAQVVRVLETDRERQLLGTSDADQDASTAELIDRARKVMSTVEVTIGPVTVQPK